MSHKFHRLQALLQALRWDAEAAILGKLEMKHHFPVRQTLLRSSTSSCSMLAAAARMNKNLSPKLGLFCLLGFQTLGETVQSPNCDNSLGAAWEVWKSLQSLLKVFLVCSNLTCHQQKVLGNFLFFSVSEGFRWWSSLGFQVLLGAMVAAGDFQDAHRHEALKSLGTF